MIPPIIHYCWFGKKEMPEKTKEYIQSWRKYLPGIKIKEWNENNFDINYCLYTRQAYYSHKYAFVSDVARLYALAMEGGIYLDTDILLKKRIPEEFWSLRGFVGFEHEKFTGTGIIGSEAQHPYIIEFLQSYFNIPFYKGFKYDITTNVGRLTKLLTEKGFIMNNQYQNIDGFAIYPQEILCGKNWTGEYYDTERTICIHDFQGTWGKDFMAHRWMYRYNMIKSILKWHIAEKYKKFK